MCPAALPSADAQTTPRYGYQSRDGSESGTAKKAGSSKSGSSKTSGAGGDSTRKAGTSKADAAKSKTVAKTSTKPASKPAAKTPDKEVAANKKSKNPSAESSKKPDAKEQAANSKKDAKSGKSGKNAPEKAVAGNSSSRKKSGDAGNADSSKKSGNAATASAKTSSGKTKSSNTQDGKPDKTRASGLASGSSSKSGSGFSTRTGLRLFGMPTGLPAAAGASAAMVADSGGSARFSQAGNGQKTTLTTSTGAAAPAPLAPLVPPHLDVAAARAAMEATARKQSVFHPAVVAVPEKPAIAATRPEPAPRPAADKSEPVAFVIKSSPVTTPPPADDSKGFGDYLFSRTIGASLRMAGDSHAAPAHGSPSADHSKINRTPAGREAPENLELPEPALTTPKALPVVAKAPASLPAVPAEAAEPETKPAREAEPEPVNEKKAPPAREQVKAEKPASAPKLKEEPELPASEMPEELAKAPTENDDSLSERERAFVQSLAKAAYKAADSGHLPEKHSEFAHSIATSATTVVEESRTEKVSTRSVPVSMVTAAREKVKEVKEAKAALSEGLSNDLMPATPDKIPESLPAFNGPATGKVDIQSVGKTDFDQANNKVIFTGKVELNCKTIRLRGDRVEVYMKKEGGGMERVEASGNVLMRTQATETGSGQMASAGHASYNLKTGEITLTEWPKIQEDGKSHVSTSASTKMYLKSDGSMVTDGPNRTLIAN